MEAAVAAELQRLAGVDDTQGYAGGESSSSGSEEEEEDLRGSVSSGSDANEAPGQISWLSEQSGADEAGAAHGQATADGTADSGGNQPSTSGQHAADGRTGPSRSNARDLKATGVARAAARLLETDDPDGGLAILSKSKSVAKRQQQEAQESSADKAAKRMRLEMRQRGHVPVPKHGEDPQQDAQEKALLKTATRGVVRLFNAVSKAQREQKEALVGGSRSRAAKLDKASFLAELRGVGKGQKAVALPAGTGPATASPAQQPSPQPSTAPGWGVLSDSFGLPGVAKMKDWDKQDDSEADIADEGLQDFDSDSNA